MQTWTAHTDTSIVISFKNISMVLIIPYFPIKVFELSISGYAFGRKQSALGFKKNVSADWTWIVPRFLFSSPVPPDTSLCNSEQFNKKRGDFRLSCLCKSPRSVSSVTPCLTQFNRFYLRMFGFLFSEFVGRRTEQIDYLRIKVVMSKLIMTTLYIC